MSCCMPRVRCSLTTAVLLAVAGGGCATDDDMSADVDTTAPAVARTLPEANAIGVRDDQHLEVTFSEPMNQASVEAAYASDDLPAEQVTFAWSADGTILTITPSALLAYAEGTGVNPAAVAAKTFAITIGTGATDLAGNALAAPMELTFATRRRLLALFGLDTSMTRVTQGASSLDATEILVGDHSNTSTYRSYLTFDLTTLPEDAELERAQFQGRQVLVEGAPYAMGPVNVHHVVYTSTLATALNTTFTISTPGALSSDAAQEIKTIDVTSQVISDIADRAERNHRSQYRLQINPATNGDAITDRATFGKNTFVLGAIYTVE
jgi:hypothetical protein